ncbi:MAG: helix-turn-helix transcriptional regulator [Bacteroidota bacterium]|jgi:transcriptional regulator with XRE-family HTH domain
MLYHQRKSERLQLGKNIKSIRGMKGLPLKFVANELGMSISNLSNIENGITGIELKTLLKLAIVFGIDHQQIQVFNPDKLIELAVR